MTIDDYQDKAMRTASGMDYRKYKKTDVATGLLINGLMGLNGEAGECIDILKKHLFQEHKLDKEHLAEELGDVMWYVAVSAEALGYKLSDIVKMNVVKLINRYPDGFDPERSIHRQNQ